MPSTPRHFPLPTRPSPNSSDDSSPNHYQEVANLAKLPLRKKALKNKRQPFWSEQLNAEIQSKIHKKRCSRQDSNKPVPAQGPYNNPSTLERRKFFENPLLDRELTLPRAELWCKDPGCRYNNRQQIDHYTLPHFPDIHSLPPPRKLSRSFLREPIPETDEYTTSTSGHSTNGVTTDSGCIGSSSYSSNSMRGGGGESHSHSHSSGEGHSTPTLLTGFDTSTSTSGSVMSGKVGVGGHGHEAVVNVDSDGSKHNNSQDIYSKISSPTSGTMSPVGRIQGYHSNSSSGTPTDSYCPNCRGVVALSHLDTNIEIGLANRPSKGDPDYWRFNKFQHPLQRDHSFHSVGGFTLNGQYNATVKKKTMVKFCSSHKISLVVSTFSLLVTIGLLITLFLMKKRGMMDTMMDS